MVITVSQKAEDSTLFCLRPVVLCLIISPRARPNVSRERRGGLEKVMDAVRVSTQDKEPDFDDMRELVFLLGRVWLQMLWVGPGLVNSRNVNDKNSEKLRAAIFELAIGIARVVRWVHAINAQKRAMAANPGGKQEQSYEMEYGIALSEANVLSAGLSQFTSGRSLEASLLSIQESKRSIEEAHAITRLTQLAFVFLPLTFVTGVFGMNIKPFKDGADTWKFAITLVSVAVPAFLFGMRTAGRDIMRYWNGLERYWNGLMAMWWAGLGSICSSMAQRVVSRDTYTNILLTAMDRGTQMPPPKPLFAKRRHRLAYKLELLADRWSDKAKRAQDRSRKVTQASTQDKAV
jgi:hypothetical protein